MTYIKRKQLYIDKDDPKEIYPVQYMENVFDGDSDENLYAYLSKFSCINVGQAKDAENAHKLVPKQLRTVGILCTYYVDTDHVNIEQYLGSVEHLSDDAEFAKPENWKPIVGTDSIVDGTITLEKLSDEVKDLLGANPNVSIQNYPDGEDLTQYDVCGENSKYPINVLKFADKDYKPSTFSGQGRKFLRKNIVDGKNLLVQEMMSLEHTIYVIQYDYDLDGATITVPAGCTLWFFGGSVKNGTITCDGTDIYGVRSKAGCGGATIAGTLAAGCALT